MINNGFPYYRPPQQRPDPRWANVYQQGANQGLWAPDDFDPQFDFQGHINEFVPQEVGQSAPKAGGNFDYGAAITGGLGLAANAIGMAQQGSGLDMSAPEVQRSATGEPIYDGSFYNQASNFKPQGATGGEVLGMAGQGAAAGASFGLPGVAIGAVGGAIAGLIGGGARRRRQKREKAKAMKSATARQNDFNEASETFDQSQIAQQEYNKRMNMTNRLYNLYGSQTQRYF